MKFRNYHMKATITLIFITALGWSCQPRIDLDLSQWGDRAVVTNIQLFAKEVRGDFQLAEYYENDGQLTTGVRRVIMTGTQADVDRENATVTLRIPPRNDLAEAGFLITHTSARVEPLDGAPKGGELADLSGGTFKYRLYSADGTTREWTITVVER